MHLLPHPLKTAGGGLLRILFLRDGEVPPDPRAKELLHLSPKSGLSFCPKCSQINRLINCDWGNGANYGSDVCRSLRAASQTSRAASALSTAMPKPTIRSGQAEGV